MTIEGLTEEETRILARAARSDARFDFTMKFGGLVLLSAGGILAWQCWQWLQTARWSAYSFGDLLDRVGIPLGRVSWAGVQQMIDWVLALPAPSVLFVFGLGVLWSALLGNGAYDAPGLNKARVKQAAILIEQQKTQDENRPSS